ncbi:death effector domain-containing 1 [Scomber scombrus]|uniref:Death effector domain-containing 1 n=1 Tax=Scomber scombrus TaxID=13677 RepID=A0AAV1P3N8_SCOSC
MAVMLHPGYPIRDSLYWDETECLNYYGMLSLHEVFEIVGSQLTEPDIEVLSFLLNEACSAAHPLDPAGWTVKPSEGEAVDSGVSPSPELLKAWRRFQPQGSQHPLVASYMPKSGLELLLELERREYLSDGNLEPLLELLRVLTRHDLLPLVSHKKRRTVSPERNGQRYGIEDRESVCTSGMRHSSRQAEIPLPSFTQQLRTGIYPPMPGPPPRRRKKRGHGWSRKPRKISRQVQPLPPPLPPHKASCVLNRPTCVCQENSILTHNERERTNTKCSNYAKWYRVIFVYGEKREFCLPLSQYSPNSPLSWSVVQQKNGSIKS